MYEEFWRSSAMVRRDTRDSLALLFTRAANLSLATSLPPEEVTTFNLVRELVTAVRPRGGRLAAAFHSRALEGGMKKAGRPPTGADLELAVEVRPGEWIDLVLQAKRQYGPSGGYDAWKVSQVRSLRGWAALHGRQPGMLLYNGPIHPFGPPGPATLVHQGVCCSSPIRCDGGRRPKGPTPNNRSPLAVTLVVLPDSASTMPRGLGGNRVTATAASMHSSPLECIFCPRIGGLIRVSGAAPRWAEQLMAEVAAGTPASQDSVSSAPVDDADDSDGRFRPLLSLVMSQPNG